MSSRQVNFYLTPSDQEELEKELRKVGDFIVLRDDAPFGKIAILKDMKISNMKDIGNESSCVYLARNEDVKSITLNTIQGKSYKAFDEFKSPIVQFIRCRYIDRTLREGRMYVINSYSTNNIIVKKEESFLKWSSALFMIVRRNLYKYNNSIFYYGAEALRFKETGGTDFQ
jgi:hypothetical protein